MVTLSIGQDQEGDSLGNLGKPGKKLEFPSRLQLWLIFDYISCWGRPCEGTRRMITLGRRNHLLAQDLLRNEPCYGSADSFCRNVISTKSLPSLVADFWRYSAFRRCNACFRRITHVRCKLHPSHLSRLFHRRRYRVTRRLR